MGHTQGTAEPRGGTAGDVFARGGEMGALCREMDWANTPLGPVDEWHPALRLAVRTALESPFPINLWCGPELVLIYNDGYRHVLGGKHPASLGRRGSEVWHEIWAEIEPMFTGLYAGAEPAYADDAPFLIERAGEPMPSEPNAWYTFSLSPVRGDEGEIVAFINIVSETTGRVIAEAETRAARAQAERAEALFRDMFLQAPAFMALLRGHGHVFEFVNDAYYSLVGHRELIGKPVFEALPELRGQGFEELLDGVVATGEPFVGRELPVLVTRVPGGTPEQRYVDLVYYPLTGEDGMRSGVVAHGSDVTAQVTARQEVEEKAEELARLARALEGRNRELDQFAYVASHDLKAPLRGIANLSQWIEDDLADRFTDEAREQMRLLRGRVARMEGLIDGILQYSRADRMQAAPERVDVGELVGEVVELLSPPEEVTMVVQPGLPVLLTERLPLQQVFMNLVSNAVKYGSRGEPRVEVTGHATDDGWEFQVRDNGPGIAPRYHERIFTIFQTLESRDKVEGTGIGLSIVKKMVESRGGRVWVESEEGRGATFHFAWPNTRAEGES